jgi:hypothetical protein
VNIYDPIRASLTTRVAIGELVAITGRVHGRQLPVSMILAWEPIV